MHLRLVPLSILLSFTFGSVFSGQNPGTHAGHEIKQLWSADDKDRENAKQKLLQIGQAAVPELIIHLEGILVPEKPHYATGRQAQGEAAWVRLMSSTNLKERDKAEAEYKGAELTEILARDAGQLLGQLESKEALRLLIGRLLDDQDTSGTKRNWHPAMFALSGMGSFAVPGLIEAIETAHSRAAAIQYADGQGSSDLAIDWGSHNIQTRAAMILGKIGDASVLPVLSGLECKPNTVDCSYIREAISAISARTK